jgi:hypothetical protein
MILPGILASAIQGHLGGNYTSIATQTVGAGGASSVTFSSIPNTYTHLQVRFIGQSGRTNISLDETHIQFNGDTGANYAQHALCGNGTTAFANNVTSGTDMELGYGFMGDTLSNVFGVGILDILDYTNNNKNKVIRFLGGVDMNGTVGSYGGRVGVSSGLWLNTSTISSIKLYANNGNWNQYSSFALYGVK